MNYSILSLAKVQRLFAVLAILALVFGPMSPAFAQGNPNGNPGGGNPNDFEVDPSVNLCHATPAEANPYTDITVDASAIINLPNGHDDHDDDIIPPFQYGDADALLNYDGKNWDAEGQAIYNNGGCDGTYTPPPTTGNLTVVKTVINDNLGTKQVSDFALFVNGNAVTSGAVNVLAPATYTVSETPDAGYTATFGGDCDTSGSVSISAGDNKTCTITNNDVVPVSGCTDQSALNYDRTATVDNGSCMYMCAYSDTATTINGVPSVLTWIHNNWTDEFEDDGSPAEWIWDAYEVLTPNPQTLTFTKSFYADASADAELRIAVDNSYTATFNGVPVPAACDGSGTGNHSSADTCPVSVVAGLNTLVVEATNTTGSIDPQSNPAGLIFDIITENTTCENALPNGGSITIVKDFVDEAPESWSFDFTGDLGEFTLEDGDDSITFSNLEADEYLFNEVVTGNWSVPAVSCTDGSGAGQGEDQLVVALGEGEDVTCTFTNREKEPEAPLCIGENLLLNGSFEDPVIGGDWTLVDMVTNWLISGVTQFELWNTFNGSGNDVADDGVQNLELDSTGSGTITQTINTVAGNEYKVAFAFSPRAGVTDNEVEVGADGVVLGSVSADGSANSTNVWSDHYFTFTATDSSTDITFSDLSVSDSLGTLLDDTQVCLTEDNSAPLYTVYGNVWNDENENDERDLEGEEYNEDTLEGWLVTITDGEFMATTTSDEFGYYEFQVPAGNYTITQEMQDNWALTYPNEGFHEVCVPIACAEVSFVEAVVSFFIPTAHAQVAGFGPFDFGNVRTAPGYSQGSYGGGGNGRSISLRDDTPDGEVAGDSTSRPEGEVLGEATSVMPVGAPNTGAGGASQNAPSAHLHALLAILSASPMRKKHG